MFMKNVQQQIIQDGIYVQVENSENNSSIRSDTNWVMLFGT